MNTNLEGIKKEFKIQRLLEEIYFSIPEWYTATPKEYNYIREDFTKTLYKLMEKINIINNMSNNYLKEKIFIAEKCVGILKLLISLLNKIYELSFISTKKYRLINTKFEDVYILMQAWYKYIKGLKNG